MKSVDVAVIGGGILGCFAARNLMRWNLSVVLIEKELDICTGITRANSAIVYAGYDNKTGSRKAELTVRGNASFDDLCRELEVPFSRCGSLLVTYDKESLTQLRRKWEQGIRNGVLGLELLTGGEAEAMEPMLAPGVAGALYAPTTGTVNPWQLGIAAFENAAANGMEPMLGTTVVGIRKTKFGYLVETDRSELRCRAVINCAGLSADRIQELCFPSDTHLLIDGAEYLVLDKQARKPKRVIFQQAQSCGKGITAIPCVEGNLLLSGVRKPVGEPFATTKEGISELKTSAVSLFPNLNMQQVIRSFAAARPNPQRDDGESLHDFSIAYPAPGFFSLIGIKTPGLTCANELGGFMRRQLVVCGEKGTVQLLPFEAPPDEGARTALVTGVRECFNRAGGWFYKGDQYQTEPFDRYIPMMKAFASYVRKEAVNPFSPDYELEVYRTVLKACGKSGR